MTSNTHYFDLPAPDGDTDMAKLGEELQAFAIALDETLHSFKFGGSDPSSILPRVVSLETKHRDLDTRLKAIERRKTLDVPNRQLSGLSWPGSGDGWTWSAPIEIKFPAGMFTTPPAVSTPSVWAEGFLVFAMLTGAPTKDGFSMRVVKKTAVALSSVRMSYSATQKEA